LPRRVLAFLDTVPASRWNVSGDHRWGHTHDRATGLA
jgi:hypothetical protein